MNTELEHEPSPRECSSIMGNRIVELGYVITWAMDLQYNHSKICTCGKLYVEKENRKNNGLVSTIVFKCTMCNRVYEYDTENPKKDVSDINNGAVWGTLATGSTYGHMEEFLSCMDIPCMTDHMFYKIENDLEKDWETSLWKSMENAGVREKQHAIEKKQLCSDGTPWITVYVDGSWSKRSYGTNFNSLSGMVGIIGRFTGELLYIGVRNKYCSICSRSVNKNEAIRDHTCYKNWSDASPAMEADIAVEGFSSSERMHGIRYMQFIADGDSSLFAKIRTNVPYGQLVRKIECTNHALKNYGKHLRNIKKDTTINVQGRKMLTLNKINLLTKRAKCSIYEHSKKENNNVELLRVHLKNSVKHVFGDHSECTEDICNTPGDTSNNKIPDLKATGIYDHLHGTLNLLLKKAHLLIENENNNAAEKLMNIVARFNMGKRLNLIQRGSYQRRVLLSGLRYNKSRQWHSSPWKRRTGRSPGQYFKKFISKKTCSNSNGPKKKLIFEENENKKKQTNTDYGFYAEEPEDCEDIDFIKMEAHLLTEQLRVSINEIKNIEQQTVGQFNNKNYAQYKSKRLTASMFGRVMKRKPYTSCHNIVKDILAPRIFFSDATEYGIIKEAVAIKLFENTMDCKVNQSGLWVDQTFGFLGASPDGLIGDTGLVEVKCIYAPNRQFSTLKELVEILKSKTFLKIINGEISLNRKHSYYFQIQGQLNITKRDECYLVVYVNDKLPLYIEKIQKDEKLWNDEMLPILTKFYTECVAPEVIRGDLRKKRKCVDPPYIQEAIAAHELKKIIVSNCK